MQFAANVFIVSLAVAATTRVGLEKVDNPRFLTIPTEPALNASVLPPKHLPQTASPVDKVTKHQPKVDTLTPEDLPSLQGTKNDVTFDFELLLKEIKACRKSYPNMSDRKFSFKLYGALLNDLTKAPNEPSMRTFCNISEGLVDGLKDTLHKLEVFQADLLPNSTEIPSRMENSQETKEPERLYSQRNIVMVEVANNLNLKLGDEWIPLEQKLNHMSHIYLGSSVFPLMTEESRVLEAHHTLPDPTATRSTQLQSNEGNDNLKLSRTVDKVHQLLLPIRWHVQAKRKATRVERSVNETTEESPSTTEESKTTVRTDPPKEAPTSTTTDEPSTKGTTKKPFARRARRPYSSMLEFLLSSWKDELTKINKSTLFD